MTKLQVKKIRDISKAEHMMKQLENPQTNRKIRHLTNEDDFDVETKNEINNFTKTSAITNMLELNNLGLDDEYFKQFQTHNIKDTLYPINGVCYFCGQKGSGKTYLLSAVIQYAFKLNEIKRLIYIYSDNVDTTIIRALPRSKILSVPKAIAGDFLQKFLNKKTKFTSCWNFLYSCEKLGYDETQHIKDSDLYIDNLLEQISSKKKLLTLKHLVEYCRKTVKKYKRGTILRFGDGSFTYDLGDFDLNQYDMICIDDIGQFLDIFGSTRRNSELYKYFTITRQNKTAIYLTGQEIKQLPKMMREMLGAIVMLNGTNINEMSDVKIPIEFQREFHRQWIKLKQYEGIVYNFNDKEYEIIKYK